MTSLIDEYFSTIEEYSKKYKNVIVLMQKGTFYEMYEYNLPNRQIGHCHEIRDALKDRSDVPYELTLTMASSKVEHSLKNPYLIGFPKAMFDVRWKHVLVHLGYTIVKMEEMDTYKHNRLERKVTEIVTEGTIVDPSSTSSCIVCVYIDQLDTNNTRFESTPVQLAGASIDLVTGKTQTIECNDVTVLYRFTAEAAAKEMFVFSSESVSGEYLRSFTNYIQSSHRYADIRHSTSVSREYNRVEYQREFLRNLFVMNSNLCPIEVLGFERERYALLAFMLLVQSVYDYNETITKKLQRPVRYTDMNRAYIPYNTVQHLHLLDVKNESCKQKGLFGTINFTHTAMGRRYLKERLLQPFTDIAKIRRVHRDVDAVTTNVDSLRRLLKSIPDIEKMAREVALQTLSSSSFNTFIDGIRAVCTLNDESPIKIKSNCAYTLLTFLERHVNQPFTLTIDKPSFPFTRENALHEEFTQLYNELATWSEKFAPHSQIEWIDGVCLVTMTRARAKKVTVQNNDVKGNRASIHTPHTKIISDRLCFLKLEIEKQIKNMYIKLLKIIHERCGGTLQKIVAFVTRIDYACSIAHCSRTYNYCRPTLVKGDCGKVDAKQLRHPIIERLLQDEEYVPNDIDMSSNGMLLYGPNSIGKTSLARAIGVCVIMAQMGYGVAASHLQLTPFTRILSRLSGNDDLHRGHSSFVVEMLELRRILQQSDDCTLVLGDELCRGTESTSGTALTVATIRRLLKTKTTFIFATHMHHLVDCEYLHKPIESDQLRIRHLHISRDPANPHVLVYDRKLVNGPSPSVYGLEIAASLDLDADFLRDANDIRKSLGDVKPHIINTKKSKYNAKVYVDECFKCKQRKDLHTHHLREQHEADDQGFIEHVHKNSKANLLVVCNTCHQQLHIDNIQLKRMRTSQGVVVVEIA